MDYIFKYIKKEIIERKKKWGNFFLVLEWRENLNVI